MEIPNLTINSFFENAVKRDFSRDYLFRILRIGFDNGVVLGEDQLIYAKTGKLPARNIVNQQAKYAGQTFNLPGASEFPGSEGYSIEFYCPEDSSVRELLMNESYRTFNNTDGTAGSGEESGTIASDRSIITLVQFDKNLDSLYQYDLIGCNVREVGEVSYSIAEGNGAIMSFTATIAYHYFVRTALGDNLVEPFEG